MPVEELILYALLIVVGAIPLTSAVKAGDGIGVEATLGILMIGLGTIGVAQALIRAWVRAADNRRRPR